MSTSTPQAIVTPEDVVEQPRRQRRQRKSAAGNAARAVTSPWASLVAIIIAALWTICGMIIVAGQMPEVADALRPIFSPILPHNPAQAALFFGVLGAALSIYRGPLVVVGTGAAVLAIILSNNEIPVQYLYAIWLAPTVMHASMDPTNSWTLWTIGYTRVSHGQFLKTALPFGWLMVAIGSAICYAWLG